MNDTELSAEALRTTDAVLERDKEALEAIEQVALTHPGLLRELSVGVDLPELQLRQLVKQRIEGERAVGVMP